uniref:p2Y purinoceptor 11-like protein n=2 Tax=Callorhinchus milii TaxID=7868 RepID=V9L2Q3_CALMI|eukprot:gi/632984378/ref/XP_007909111.1/ PREDICTED: P2Y purinoceptor 11 [Callorhinchus milii]
MSNANGSSNDSFGAVQMAVLPPLLGVECVLALAGNSLAVWLFVCRVARPWHSGTVLAFSLALSDLLYAASLPLLIAYYASGKSWRFGQSLCRAERFLFTCNLYGSILFITFISLNRYLGIVRPMLARAHVRPGRAKLASLAGWLLTAAITGPTLSYSQLEERHGKLQCLGTAVDARLAGYLHYSLFLAVWSCALPFLVTLSCYLSVVRAVWASPSVERAERHRVLALVLVVLSLYGVSFLPYTVLRNVNLYRRLHGLDQAAGGIYKAYQVSKGLVTLNACLHPLLYAALPEHAKALCCPGRGQQDTPAYTGATEVHV